MTTINSKGRRQSRFSILLTVMTLFAFLFTGFGVPSDHTGSWYLKSYKYGTDQLIYDEGPPNRAKIKLITGNHFTTVTIDENTGQIIHSYGGRQTIAGNIYTETIDFSLGVDPNLGSQITYNARIEDGRLLISKTRSDGIRMEEEWVRMTDQILAGTGEPAARTGQRPEPPIMAPGRDDLYYLAEEMPWFLEEGMAYKGFREFIAENIRYPEEAKDHGIDGRVFVQLTVKADGSVGDVKLVKGVHPLLDEEAVRVIESSPSWTPGRQDGEPVDVVFTMPVTFMLDDKETGDVFFIVEQMPQFNGMSQDAFREYLAQNLRYPESAKENGIEGRVFVQFTVKSDGSVADAKVVRGVDPALDREALRIVNDSPDWTPGRQQGQAVNVAFTFPVTFKL